NIWEGIARALLARPGTIWLASLAAMAPFVVIAVIHYKELDYGISTEIPKTAPSWAGTKILKDHFAAGVTGPTTVLLTNHQVYFGSLESIPLLRDLTQTLQRQQDFLQLADIRSLAFPFGITQHGNEALTNILVSTPAAAEVVRRQSFRHF